MVGVTVTAQAGVGPGGRAPMSVMGTTDLWTGTTLYTSQGTAGQGWAAQEVKEERTSLSLLPSVLARMDRWEPAGNTTTTRGPRKPMERSTESHSYDLVGQRRGASGGLNNIFKVHFFTCSETYMS